MNTKKLFGWLLKLPMIVLILASLGGGIYAAYKHISGVTYATPIIIGAIIALYLWGAWLHTFEESD